MRIGLSRWLTTLGVLLGLAFLTLGGEVGTAKAADDTFRAGVYSCRNQNGSVICQLNFLQDPQAPLRYIVNGWIGGVVTIPITGTYSIPKNQLSARTVPPTFVDAAAAQLMTVDINGGMLPDRGVFHVQPSIYKTGYELVLDQPQADAGKAHIEISNIRVESPVSGALLRGKFHLNATNVRSPQTLHGLGWFTQPANFLTKTILLTINRDEDRDYDLAVLGMTVPVEIDESSISLGLTGDYASPRSIFADSPTFSIGKRSREVYVFACDGSVAPDVNGKLWLHYAYSLRAKSQPGLADSKWVVKAQDTVTIEAFPLGSGPSALGGRVNDAATVTEQSSVRFENDNISIPEDLQPGRYRIVVRIEGELVTPYVKVIDFTKDDDGKTPPPAPKVIPDADIDGFVTYQKPTVKVNESFTLDLKYQYDYGADDLEVDELVEAVGPDGVVKKSLKAKAHLYRGQQHTHSFRGLARKPGTYTLKVTVSGPKCRTWTNTTTFEVKEEPGHASNPQPPVNLANNPVGGKGTFGLVKKEIGKAVGPDNGPYGTWSGSQGENSFAASYQCKPPYVGTFSANYTWSAPPAVLKPDEIIELTSSGSASVTGKDIGSPGCSACWGVSGGAEVIESTCAFAGVSGSTGKLIGSSQGKTKVKIPRGGEFTLYSSHPGINWGSGGVWNPCVYTYKYDEVPSVKPEPENPPHWDPPPPPTGGDDDGSGLTLAATDPPAEECHLAAHLDPDHLELFAGETSKISDVHISGFRTNTLDRVEVIFPQKTDNWAALPGQIVVGGGDGSYDPANMGRPEHVDGYFFSARRTAPGGTFTIDIIVRQKGCPSQMLHLGVKVRPKPWVPPPEDPQPPVNPPIPPIGPPHTPPRGPAMNFEGEWETTYGHMSLKQRGLHVEGTYEFGVLTGTVNGDTLTFKIDETPITPIPGYGQFLLNPDGNEFDGGWTYSDRLQPPLSPWHGKRSGAAGKPGATFHQDPTGRERPRGEQPRGENPRGEKPMGERPTGEKPTGERPSGERPRGEMPAGEKPTGEKPTGEKPTGEKPVGDPPAGPGVPVHRPPGGPGFIPPGNNGRNPPGGGKGGGPRDNTPPGITPSDTAHGKPGTVGGDSGAGGPLTPAGGRLDPNAWAAEGEKGTSAAVSGDRLVLDVPKSSDGETHSFAKATLKGDFDVTVDYALLDWKPGPESMLQWSIYVADKPDVAAKNQLYISHIAEGRSSDVVVARSNSDKTRSKPAAGKTDGKIRIARAGNTWTVSQWSGAKWDVVETLELPLPAEVHFGVGLERNGPVGVKASLRPHKTEGP